MVNHHLRGRVCSTAWYSSAPPFSSDMFVHGTNFKFATPSAAPTLDLLPDYELATSSSDNVPLSQRRMLYMSPSTTHSTQSSPALNNASNSPFGPSIPTEKYRFTYSVQAGSTPLVFIISVEPGIDPSDPRKHKIQIALKTGQVERKLNQPLIVNLSVDPRHVEFRLFLYPGKTCLPENSLWSYRVWLCVNRIEHRLFGDDGLWVGRDLDFGTIENASFARLTSLDSCAQSYEGLVGRAPVTFTARWKHLSENAYSCAMEYDGGGMGGPLFDDLQVTMDCTPRSLSFLIYSVPVGTSAPPLANHRLRVWLRIPTIASTATSSFGHLSLNDSYVYQRIWKSDNFKIGSHLDYESFSDKISFGVLVGGGPVHVVPSLPNPEQPRRWRSANVIPATQKRII